ncbi:MAG: hypothetical protein M1434_01655 [Chloroflexi bacterium]|nr:hypothetical protein [Chloroflexota bacterium]MCL5273434.1 hypothetical protein [Chloroflexota bacterium]
MRIWQYLFKAAIVAILGCLVLLSFYAVNQSLKRIDPIASTIQTPTSSVVATKTSVAFPEFPTPLPPDFIPPPPIISTATVYSITSVIDMSPTLSSDQKGETIIRRADGTYVKILTSPGMLATELPLHPGDVVVDISSPLTIVGKYPPLLSPLNSPLLTPTGAVEP